LLSGAWTGAKEDDFEFRNGTILDINTLEVTENFDILNGTLSERLLYPFGQSCKKVAYLKPVAQPRRGFGGLKYSHLVCL